eukprot:110758-Prymnesium_polylepis.2
MILLRSLGEGTSCRTPGLEHGCGGSWDLPTTRQRLGGLVRDTHTSCLRAHSKHTSQQPLQCAVAPTPNHRASQHPRHPLILC